MENKIKEVIKELGISQKELAKKVGMSEPGISNAINGSATKETLQRIADVLGINVKDIMKEGEGLYAKYSAEKTPLKLGKIEIPCYVLNNGQRVFSGRGIQKALGVDSNASGTWLSKFIASTSISSNLAPGILQQFSSPIKFKRNNAGGSQSITYGYEATILIDLCTAVIDAFENPAFEISETYYREANAILRAVAKTGIIALVDEATGYDKAKERSRTELQNWLAKYINEEADKWVKMFPDSFFEDINKMRGWSWDCKPRYMGKIINDIVYERIAPFILEEMRKKNPKLSSGSRRYKFHQFLTSEEGKPLLKQHLAILHSFALAADFNWGRFMHLLDKAHPKQYQELAMFEEMEIG